MQSTNADTGRDRKTIKVCIATSSTQSDIVTGSRRASTRSWPTILPSSSWRQSGYGRALTSPHPLHWQLLQIVGALTAPSSWAHTCRVEEPSKASITDPRRADGLYSVSSDQIVRRLCRRCAAGRIRAAVKLPQEHKEFIPFGWFGDNNDVLGADFLQHV